MSLFFFPEFGYLLSRALKTPKLDTCRFQKDLAINQPGLAAAEGQCSPVELVLRTRVAM